MAENQGVWGIEIGQAGLKALRLRYAEAANQVVAVAFDYVPHAKILSQPDAIPEELIPQALETFLKRNKIKGDKIAIGVPSQHALARFITLPPVESGKVAEIVKYEARQQIPFALEEVIWDFQTLGGGIEESGFMLGAEVGLFAMKREQVIQSLQPFIDAKVEVELIQVAPLALQNFLCYDRLGQRVDEDFVPPDDYTLVLDMGADNTTLVVSNGEKIWIRNVPLGGNHFTRALTKEMKLTFAKAEHLKCNATKSPDPRAVFQALRPVFNDYVSEIQRSIGYFASVNREAKIVRVVGVGNGFKLAGLQKFLQQNLQYEVKRVDKLEGVVGDNVLNAPLFQENVPSFVVPYGLALQGLGLTQVHTTLIPPEIALQRQIRRKKPWAAITAASLLFGLSVSTFGYARVASSVSEDRFGAAETAAATYGSKVADFQSQYDAAVGEHDALKAAGEELVRTIDSRENWLELYRAINECLPRDVGDQQDETRIELKNQINIQSITAERPEDMAVWFSDLADSIKNHMRDDERNVPPPTEAYVVTLTGFHFHHDEKNPRTGMGVLYVVSTLLKNLQQWTFQAPDSLEPVPVGQLGISHALVTDMGRAEKVKYYFEDDGPGREVTSGAVGGVANTYTRAAGGAGGAIANDAEYKELTKTTFKLQFVWLPRDKNDRPEIRPEMVAPPVEEEAEPVEEPTG